MYVIYFYLGKEFKAYHEYKKSISATKKNNDNTQLTGSQTLFNDNENKTSDINNNTNMNTEKVIEKNQISDNKNEMKEETSASLDRQLHLLKSLQLHSMMIKYFQKI